MDFAQLDRELEQLDKKEGTSHNDLFFATIDNNLNEASRHNAILFIKGFAKQLKVSTFDFEAQIDRHNKYKWNVRYKGIELFKGKCDNTKNAKYHTVRGNALRWFKGKMALAEL